MSTKIETDLIQQLLSRVGALEAEVRALKMDRLPATGEQIQGLLSAIHEIFEGRPFTAAWVLEAAIEPGPEASALLEAVKQIIGPRPTVQKLSRLLKRSVGVYVAFQLNLINEHSRDGAVFCVSNVTQIITTGS